MVAFFRLEEGLYSANGFIVQVGGRSKQCVAFGCVVQDGEGIKQCQWRCCSGWRREYTVPMAVSFSLEEGANSANGCVVQANGCAVRLEEGANSANGVVVEVGGYSEQC